MSLIFFVIIYLSIFLVCLLMLLLLLSYLSSTSPLHKIYIESHDPESIPESLYSIENKFLNNLGLVAFVISKDNSGFLVWRKSALKKLKTFFPSYKAYSLNDHNLVTAFLCIYLQASSEVNFKHPSNPFLIKLIKFNIKKTKTHGLVVKLSPRFLLSSSQVGFYFYTQPIKKV